MILEILEQVTRCEKCKRSILNKCICSLSLVEEVPPPEKRETFCRQCGRQTMYGRAWCTNCLNNNYTHSMVLEAPMEYSLQECDICKEQYFAKSIHKLCVTCENNKTR